jgi:hypothetical protein
VALAELLYVLHDSLVVGLVMCTLALCPAARLIDASLSVPVPSMDQPPTGVAAGLDAIDQLIPSPVGNRSLTVTPVAVAAPAPPVFLTVIVKPICDPAETAAELSAVFVRVTVGHCTVTCATAALGAVPFVRDGVAVLL